MGPPLRFLPLQCISAPPLPCPSQRARWCRQVAQFDDVLEEAASVYLDPDSVADSLLHQAVQLLHQVSDVLKQQVVQPKWDALKGVCRGPKPSPGHGSGCDAALSAPAARPRVYIARDAFERKAPQRRSQKRLDRRLEEVAKAVGGGYCRLQMPLELVLAVRETVAGHRLGS